MSASLLRRFSYLLVVFLVLSACGNQSGREAGGPEWKRTSPDRLSGKMKDRFDRAETSRKTLGRTLLRRVSGVMASKGPAEAIGVCNLEAQGVTDSVGREFNVRIGRTSHKLRNPENEPPEWARKFDLIEKRVDEKVVLTKGEKRLAVLTPIHLKEKCTACHGPEDQISEPVKKKLEQRYPEDRATGFEAGDLRGWFWVEAPAERSGSSGN